MAPLLAVPSLTLSTAPEPLLVEAPPKPREAPLAIRRLLRLLIVGSLVGIWWNLFDGGFSQGEAWLAAVPGLGFAAHWVRLAGVGLLFVTSLRALLWLFYRPAPAGSYLPTVTALVPAYNEGAMVRNALLSLARSDYPAARLQVIGIDDGSQDDTWRHMQAAARLHPDRIKLLRLARNSGKRAALSAGFAAATGEIIVTADSDCIVAPDAVREIVAPLADERVGAVAGKVVVHNRTGSLLTRMLAPQFLVTFDFLRASQSVAGTVLCCPGALAAYRFSALRPLLPAWLGQTFWGRSVGPGEDRYLTTLLLRSGLQSRYQSTAVVHTLVPVHYRGICRMMLRWDRSDVRESLAALLYWPRRRGLGLLAVPFVQANVIATLVGVPLSFVSAYVVVVLLATHPLTGLIGLGSLGLPSLLGIGQALSADFSANSLLLIGYAYFYPALLWIQPYAALTLRDQAWMSRRPSATALAEAAAA
ncbi:MAG: glycosyltransferase family 2 protein [Deltaproteobacteria bacterium]